MRHQPEGRQWPITPAPPACCSACIAAGDRRTFSYGGGDTFVQTLIITQADGNAIKANINAPVNVSVSLNNTVSLAGGMAGTSSRGPSISYNQIKPDVGAPGASISAIAGSGTGTEAFGGTSGAAPMVSGAAALLLDAYPARCRRWRSRPVDEHRRDRCLHQPGHPARRARAHHPHWWR